MQQNRFYLKLAQDADGNFGQGQAPSGVPTSLMYFHDLGTHYQDKVLLEARERSLRKLLEMQHLDTENPRLDGGIQGAYELMGHPDPIPDRPAKHVNSRCTLYALIALLKLESNLSGIWLGRHNQLWQDPLYQEQYPEHMKKLGYPA